MLSKFIHLLRYMFADLATCPQFKNLLILLSWNDMSLLNTIRSCSNSPRSSRSTAVWHSSDFALWLPSIRSITPTQLHLLRPRSLDHHPGEYPIISGSCHRQICWKLTQRMFKYSKQVLQVWSREAKTMNLKADKVNMIEFGLHCCVQHSSYYADNNCGRNMDALTIGRHLGLP